MAVDQQDELLEVLDERGAVVGVRRRAEVHSDPSLVHRAVHVIVRNRRGEVFLQRRSRQKRIQPGRWDSSVGGHVDPGESYEDAAERELAEELGASLSRLGGRSALVRLHDYVWRTSVETERVRTFQLLYEGPFELHPEEIEEGRFWSVSNLRAAAGGGELTPNLEHELRLLGLIPTAERART